MSDGIRHVVPQDNRMHVCRAQTCWCRPTLQAAPDGQIIVHHWLGRKYLDRGNGPWQNCREGTGVRADA